MTSKPNSRSCLAAIRPAIPAPITTIFPCVMSYHTNKKKLKKKYFKTHSLQSNHKTKEFYLTVAESV